MLEVSIWVNFLSGGLNPVPVRYLCYCLDLRVGYVPRVNVTGKTTKLGVEFRICDDFGFRIDVILLLYVKFMDMY